MFSLKGPGDLAQYSSTRTSVGCVLVMFDCLICFVDSG